MARYAEIRDGVVVQFLDLPEGVSIEQAVHPDLLDAFVPALPGIAIGWTHADGAFAGPTIPAEPSVDLRAYASDVRWQTEIGGIVLGGVPIATDVASQGKILAAYVAASRDPDWETLWNSVHPISAATMLAIGDAVQAHINATFLKRAEIWAAIDAGEITTTAQIDAAFAD